ncbi:hypothetical protein SOCE26_046970 [Sorangium cellulosum]|uniref:Lcl C-terminal domain-containing protein n=1 Tax=Sorangium cellulosum TaxID=56 RepID=A0A2L0EVD1_SORCE|nr:DUF1566 domain-containing protein [Sorangium cellulosum]AUX43253.1 hypothetical protein SOCE26_046970 [Sorangium cellulosum]
MPNETPYALPITAFLMAVLFVESAALGGCVGDPFQIGGGAGGGTGGSGSGSSSGTGGGGASGAGGAGGDGGGGGEGGSLPPVPVTWPDSMTRRCSNGTIVVTECPDPEEPFFGQDGNYQILVPSYEERDGDVVADSVTGLVWEQATENVSYDLEGADVHCKALATNARGGRTDWRLPTRRELVSILDFGHSAAFPDLFTSMFSGGFYWSASDVADDEDRAWGVRASDGTVQYRGKTEVDMSRALCVAGEVMAPPELSAADGDARVLDTTTGFVWQRNITGIGYAWREALAHCEGLELAGHDDWRLPSAKELLSLIDDRRSGPALDDDIFTGASAGVFWSSTPALGSADTAFTVNFSNGASLSGSVRDPRLVRCVRSDDPAR